MCICGDTTCPNTAESLAKEWDNAIAALDAEARQESQGDQGDQSNPS